MKIYVSLVLISLQTITLFGQTRNSLDDGRKIKIPVVFHIIFNNAKENISDSIILKELHDLNLDYSQRNDMSLLDKEFLRLIGNPNIEFYLLDTSLQSGGINGVRRIQQARSLNRDNLLINPKNCLNVLVANQGNNAPFIGVGDHKPNIVNLNYEDVGTEGHALTHETGHWLGLYHIFGKIGSSSWIRKTFGDRDDEIEDTPEQKGATAICYEITSRCPCPPKNIYYKKQKRMYNNFMDYNPCRCMFTIGQAIQIRNKIIEDRRELFDNSL
jgi:hypothetical protein